MPESLFYVLSGTGNSLRLAKNMAENLGRPVRVVRTEEARPSQDLPDSGRRPALLGLFMPTHGFTSPWHMIKFAARLPRGRGTPALAISTRAGIRLGRWVVPGIAGTNALLIAFILVLKGYRMQVVASVDMPSNWYSLHPIQGERSLKLLLQKAEGRANHLAQTVQQRQRHLFTLNNLWDAVWGVAMSLFSCLYLCVGRFFLAKLFFGNNNCDGCGVCAKHCPDQAFVIWGRKRPRPFWRYNCESCMRCAAICPHGAIEAGHSWAALLYFLWAVPLAYLGLQHVVGDAGGRLLGYVLLYPALFLSYGLFFFGASSSLDQLGFRRHHADPLLGAVSRVIRPTQRSATHQGRAPNPNRG